MHDRPTPTRVANAVHVRCSHRDDAARLARRCSGDHVHLSAADPGHRLRCKAAYEGLVRAILTPSLTPRSAAHQALPADAVGADAAPPGAAGDVVPAVPVSPATLHAIAKLHTQTGHPAPDHLARAIRLAGGSDEAVIAALRYRCSVCARLPPPGPSAPRALDATARELGDSVALDTFTLAGCQGNVKLFLSIIDVTSRFRLTLELASRSPLVWETFVNGWCMWAGFPATLLADGGGEFEAGFREESEGPPPPIAMKTAAAETPQQNRICERRGGIWKGVAKVVIDQHSDRSSTSRGPSGPPPSVIVR